ncbi:unnamed protein product, partial [Rotaria sordida]
APLSTGKPATSSGCTRLIQSLQLRSDGQQGWCGCTSIPTLAWSRSLFNEDPMCEEQQTKVIETLQKLRIHLYPFETTITIGGHYIIPNLLWNNTSEYNRCDLNSLSQCQATKHSGLKDDDDGDDSQVCLFNEDEIANYTQNQLKTDRFTKVLPYESENISQLPFPDAFNVTINSVKPSTLCATSNSAISCHLAIDNDCSFYFCHTINITQVIEVTFEYNRPEKDTAIKLSSSLRSFLSIVVNEIRAPTISPIGLA